MIGAVASRSAVSSLTTLVAEVPPTPATCTRGPKIDGVPVVTVVSVSDRKGETVVLESVAPLRTATRLPVAMMFALFDTRSGPASETDAGEGAATPEDDESIRVSSRPVAVALLNGLKPPSVTLGPVAPPNRISGPVPLLVTLLRWTSR